MDVRPRGALRGASRSHCKPEVCFSTPVTGQHLAALTGEQTERPVYWVQRTESPLGQREIMGLPECVPEAECPRRSSN